MTHLARYAFGIGATIALLAGCGESQPPIGSTARSAAATQVASRTKAATGSSETLLYVTSNAYPAAIFVLSYPQGRVLTSFQPPITGTGLGPRGLCSDSSGDIFVPVDLFSSRKGYIYEYAHGGSTPIATFDDKYYPEHCAVDSVTGDLAVTNSRDESSLAIYKRAQGAATYYSDPTMTEFVQCGYDANGNLFVGGWNNGNPPYLTELPYGKKHFTDIFVSTLGRHIGRGGTFGSLQWSGSGLAALRGHLVYRLTITGSTATIEGKTRAQSIGSIGVIDGKRLIAIYRTVSPNEVAFWKYPKGGPPTLLINDFGPQSKVDGVAISVGSAQ